MLASASGVSTGATRNLMVGFVKQKLLENTTGRCKQRQRMRACRYQSAYWAAQCSDSKSCLSNRSLGRRP
jgi:hypothetical protein